MISGIEERADSLLPQTWPTCEKKLIIVPGATHLFEEPDTLEQVAEQASKWFQRHLKRVG